MSEKDIYTERDDAWEKLTELAGGHMEARKILDPFRKVWEAGMHNVVVAHYKDGKPESYKSTIKGFPSYGFATELEANLANAIFMIYKASGNEFREDKFRMVFQVVLALLDIESDWRM